MEPYPFFIWNNYWNHVLIADESPPSGKCLKALKMINHAPPGPVHPLYTNEQFVWFEEPEESMIGHSFHAFIYTTYNSNMAIGGGRAFIILGSFSSFRI